MATKQKNSKFMQPMKPSKDLAAVVGDGPMPRTEVTKKTVGLHQEEWLARHKK